MFINPLAYHSDILLIKLFNINTYIYIAQQNNSLLENVIVYTRHITRIYNVYNVYIICPGDWTKVS